MVTSYSARPANVRSIDDRLVSWQEIAADFVNGGVLIGNGFSQAVWRKFGYSSIYEAACSPEYITNPLTQQDKRLFGTMGTTNFESVLSRLSESSEVNQIFNQEFEQLQLRYTHIKNALGEAIKAVHIPWQEMNPEILRIVRAELKRYKFIYSTNYDLLPYWAIMSENTGKDCKDFFWSKEPGNENPYFDISNTVVRHNSTRIFYLHGALHIYRDSVTGRTYKLKNRRFSNLLDIVEVPLFITEGSSQDKMKAIRRSDYLLFAYTQFLNHRGPLVIFGHSLGETDQHLIQAIRSHGYNKIAVSVRSSNSSDSIIKRKADLYKFFCEDMLPNQRPELIFFDAQTHPLGSPNIRVEGDSFYPEW